MSCALRKRSMKKKGNHFQQTPEYDTEFEFPTNMIDDSLLSEAFQKIEKIMTESNEIMRKQGKSRRALVPVINIAHTVIDRDENKFREVLTQLKSPYQTALRIKTDKQIKNGIQRREQMKKAERQRKFAEFVENLKKKGLKEYQYVTPNSFAIFAMSTMFIHRFLSMSAIGFHSVSPGLVPKAIATIEMSTMLTQKLRSISPGKNIVFIRG
jgi:hypothetical protein